MRTRIDGVIVGEAGPEKGTMVTRRPIACSIYKRRQLHAIAMSLNTMPRKALGLHDTGEAFAGAVAATA
jgi:hypothetical protein